MQSDVWTMSTGVNHARKLSDYADSELPRFHAARPTLRETTRCNAIAHVIYTSRTNRFHVNCPARRTHRHFDYLSTETQLRPIGTVTTSFFFR